MKLTTLALAFLVAWILAVPSSWGQKPEDKEHAELAKALNDAKISLERGWRPARKKASRSRRSTRSSTTSCSSRSTR